MSKASTPYKFCRFSVICIHFASLFQFLGSFLKRTNTKLVCSMDQTKPLHSRAFMLQGATKYPCSGASLQFTALAVMNPMVRWIMDGSMRAHRRGLGFAGAGDQGTLCSSPTVCRPGLVQTQLVTRESGVVAFNIHSEYKEILCISALVYFLDLPLEIMLA